MDEFTFVVLEERHMHGVGVHCAAFVFATSVPIGKALMAAFGIACGCVLTSTADSASAHANPAAGF
jgi:hypothetical protein